MREKKNSCIIEKDVRPNPARAGRVSGQRQIFRHIKEELQIMKRFKEELQIMKRFTVIFTGILAAGLLAACSPTNTDALRESMEAEVVAGPSEDETVAPDKHAPGTGPVMALVSVYRADSAGTGLERILADVEELTPQTLVDQLAGYGVLDEGTEVLSYNMEGAVKLGPGVSADEAEGSGDRIGTLDLNQVPELSAAEEDIMLRALANTFIENYELDKLKLLVNGENYTSANRTDGDDTYLEYTSKYKNSPE